MSRKLLNIFEFYKSTLAVNGAISIAAFFMGGIDSFFAVFLGFGFVVSLAVKEVNAKHDYLFYYNNGLPKVRLWLWSYFFQVCFTVAGIGIFKIMTMIL